jgi:hydrogenase/urease accessory protein HupE
MLTRALLLIAIFVATLASPAAKAHLTPNSEIQMDFGTDAVAATIIIPQGEYAFASGNAVSGDLQSRAAASDFLARHIALFAPNGARWKTSFSQVAFVQVAGPPDLRAVMRAVPPAGQSARRLTIRWDAVVDKAPGHNVLFLARQDFGGGKDAFRREILGVVQANQRTVFIDRGRPSAFAGFFSAIMLGMRHIVGGFDHLLFVIALLLPAPLLAAAGRWRRTPRPSKDSLKRIIWIVTAFTIGHSVTLIGAAFLGWKLPVQPVEIMIAVSILISAIHAFRPLFPRREPAIAAVFGLVHGLAFATVVGGYGLDLREKALTILGFNIGIELVQLLVVAAALPVLLTLARRAYYAQLRSAASVIIGLAAVYWLIERL